MRKVNLENIELINKLPFTFERKEYSLEGWGEVDFYCYHDEVLVLIEIEKGQKHPNTNVLKLWPYLEDHPEQFVLLIQIIRPENKAPKNRVKLCQFTGIKLENLFKNRFRYIFVNQKVGDSMELESIIDKKLNELA
ncbi:MAG: hypothetical protein ACMZ7B_00840 [Balneola sp.]